MEASKGRLQAFILKDYISFVPIFYKNKIQRGIVVQRCAAFLQQKGKYSNCFNNMHLIGQSNVQYKFCIERHWLIDCVWVRNSAKASAWWRVRATESRPAAVVWGRRWVRLSPSLGCFGLHCSLFPKKRRGDLGPGRRRAAAAIIGKLREIPLSHARSAPKIGQDMKDPCCSRSTFHRRHRGDYNKLTVVWCATPAQRYYVATTMDRIMIEKATWWTERKTSGADFLFFFSSSFFFLHARISQAETSLLQE